MQIKIKTNCPYCKSINDSFTDLDITEYKQISPPTKPIVTNCELEDGGCDRDYVFYTTEISIKSCSHKISKD